MVVHRPVGLKGMSSCEIVFPQTQDLPESHHSLRQARIPLPLLRTSRLYPQSSRINLVGMHLEIHFRSCLGKGEGLNNH